MQSESEAVRSYQDEVLLVTGSSRGLGRAFAVEIARAGAVTVVNSTGTSDKGDELAAELTDAGLRAHHVAGRVKTPRRW